MEIVFKNGYFVMICVIDYVMKIVGCILVGIDVLIGKDNKLELVINDKVLDKLDLL